MKNRWPVGNYVITETIDAGKVTGAVFAGAGQAYYPSDHPNDGQITRLIWEGPEDQPMIKGRIRHGQFRNIQFVNGRVHIESAKGFGTGWCLFDRCCFFGKNAGVTFGTEGLNANAADSDFRNCQFVNAENPIQLTTSQNVNYSVDRCMFYRCDKAVNVLAGGLITLNGCYLTKTPYVFHIHGDGSKVGSQNGQFVVRDLRYDANQWGKVFLVKDQGAYGWRQLVIDNVHAPPAGLGYVEHNEKVTWEIKKVI